MSKGIQQCQTMYNQLAIWCLAISKKFISTPGSSHTFGTFLVGTGVVTSVPSDSPDDFAALRDLQNKAVSRLVWVWLRLSVVL